MKNKKNICVLGLSGFPDSISAKTNRYKSIVEMITTYEDSVTVVNRDVGKRISKNYGKAKVVNSIGCDIDSYTLRKYLRKIIVVFDFFKLIQVYGLRKIDAIIVYSYSFTDIIFYKLYSFVFRAKLCLDYVEKRSQMQYRKGYLSKTINDKLFEQIVFIVFDGVIVISDFLKEEVSKQIKSNKIYKLPPVCDFEYCSGRKSKNFEKYILYCGSVGYKDVIYFVLDAYNEAKVFDSFLLYFVVSGGAKEIEQIKNRFAEFPYVRVYSYLPYEQLLTLYNNALGLIIPMRQTLQDKARFPQKITEYLASGRPLISNSWGEISNYFKNRENAVLADGYLVSSYSEILKEIARNEIDLDLIGQRGFETGQKYFSEKAHFKALNHFLHSL